MNWKGMKDNLPPLWVEKLEMTDECIENIQRLMRELSQLHTKRLMVNFEVDEESQEYDISIKTSEITDVFHRAEILLKKFSKQGDEHMISDSELTVRRNMQSQVAKKLQTLSMSFRTSQKMYMKKVQSQKNGAGDDAFDYLDEKNNNSLNSGSASTVDIDIGFTSGQMQIVEEMEENVIARDTEINAIAKSIEELAQIFKELAVLVIDQGTILDRIDYNMEAAVDHAKEGVEELVKAEEHQKNATPIRCISFLVLGIIIMLAILIHKWKGNSSSNSN
jgi:syntaxin 16